MFHFQLHELGDRAGLHLQIEFKGKWLSFQEIVQRWKVDPLFGQAFNQTLADVRYKAFRWELPGLTAVNWTLPFECVVVDSQELQRPASASEFAEHFTTEQQVMTFPNLRGDAVMIVPAPVGEPEAYPHLAAFVRHAPPPQQQLLWQTVGEVLEKRIGAKPIWLSTAGAGVAWLHVRLDDRPKYYSYGLYRDVLSSAQ